MVGIDGKYILDLNSCECIQVTSHIDRDIGLMKLHIVRLGSKSLETGIYIDTGWPVVPFGLDGRPQCMGGWRDGPAKRIYIVYERNFSRATTTGDTNNKLIQWQAPQKYNDTNALGVSPQNGWRR